MLMAVCAVCCVISVDVSGCVVVIGGTDVGGVSGFMSRGECV